MSIQYVGDLFIYLCARVRYDPLFYYLHHHQRHIIRLSTTTTQIFL